MSKKSKRRDDDEDYDRKKKKKKGKKEKTKRRKAKKFYFYPVAADDFKPFFVEAFMSLGKDGVIRDVKAVFVKGRPDSDSAKRVDMALLDPKTFNRFIARLAAATFIKTERKRLEKFSVIKMLIRVGLSRSKDDEKKDGSLRVAFKVIKFRPGKEGKLKTLEKKTPEYRAIRKANKFLPAAFTDAVAFPKGKELKKLLAKAEGKDEDGDEDRKKKKKKKK